VNIAEATRAVPLRVDRLALSFGGIQVLQDIALELRPGEITGLIGPNGAGKTTCGWKASRRRDARRSAFRAASSTWRCAPS
jgi:ABC-type uncharacterized transport system ATPase subunit